VLSSQQINKMKLRCYNRGIVANLILRKFQNKEYESYRQFVSNTVIPTVYAACNKYYPVYVKDGRHYTKVYLPKNDDTYQEIVNACDGLSCELHSNSKEWHSDAEKERADYWLEVYWDEKYFSDQSSGPGIVLVKQVREGLQPIKDFNNKLFEVMQKSLNFQKEY